LPALGDKFKALLGDTVSDQTREGFFMDTGIPNSPNGRRNSFQKIASAFLAQPGLPFAHLLSAEQIERVFSKHGGLFGGYGIYSTAIMAWSFLSQVLRDGKEASCQSAVARIVSYCHQIAVKPPTGDTGDFCRARAKLPEAALHELSCEVAGELEAEAEEAWLWKDRHAKLIDGFTFTMPDTPKNQAEYPQQKSQASGVGLPIARVVTIVSLATACVLDAAMGPYAGKQTSELALLRSIWGSLRAGDIAVMDRYYCSFMMIALMSLQGIDICARQHQSRHMDFRRGRRLGKYDHLIVWTRPNRPSWMDQATYEKIPETLELREIRYHVVEKGRRTKTLTVITTLVDPDRYTKEDIAQLYGFRWNAELDIRSIKDSLNLSHVRCKSPEMVRREVWTTLLAYNLIRTTAAGAALVHNKQPRQISFTSTCQYLLASWMIQSCQLNDFQSRKKLCLCLLAQIAACEVANRPGRLEPRVLKRRRHAYKLMQKPRDVLRRQLRKTCT
jgi:putative transposase